MQRKFLLNLFIIVLLNLLVKPFYLLGIDAEIQSRVGKEVYGVYFAVLNFTYIFNILLDLGITNYNTKNIAQHNQLLTKHFSGMILMKGLLFLVYSIAVFLLAFCIGWREEYLYFLSFLVINQFLISIILYIRSNLAGLLLFKSDSIISVLDRFILIGLFSYLLWGRGKSEMFDIHWLIYGQTFAYSITLLVAIFLLKPHLKGFRPQIKWPFTRMIMRNSIPYAMLIMFMFLYTRTDGVMLERLLDNGAESAGCVCAGISFVRCCQYHCIIICQFITSTFFKNDQRESTCGRAF